MAQKKQSSVLGLTPLSQRESSRSLVLYDPFAPIYHTLTPDEQRLVDAWRQQNLETRAKQLQGVLTVRVIGELIEEATDEFVHTALALDQIKAKAKGTESEDYVEEFIHFQKQSLALHLKNTENTTLNSIESYGTVDFSAVLAEPEQRRTFFQRLAYLIKGK